MADQANVGFRLFDDVRAQEGDVLSSGEFSSSFFSLWVSEGFVECRLMSVQTQWLFNSIRFSCVKQVEDDVVTKPGYATKIKTFIDSQEGFVMLEFASLGFIGKLWWNFLSVMDRVHFSALFFILFAVVSPNRKTFQIGWFALIYRIYSTFPCGTSLLLLCSRAKPMPPRTWALNINQSIDQSIDQKEGSKSFNQPINPWLTVDLIDGTNQAINVSAKLISLVTFQVYAINQSIKWPPFQNQFSPWIVQLFRFL